jgi:hypothetical protein
MSENAGAPLERYIDDCVTNVMEKKRVGKIYEDSKVRTAKRLCLAFVPTLFSFV